MAKRADATSASLRPPVVASSRSSPIAPSPTGVLRRQRLPSQFPVRHPVRTLGFRAQATDLVFFIGLEIPLEPFDMAVAFEGEDVGGEAVEEEAVVADDHGAAGEILDRLFQ